MADNLLFFGTIAIKKGFLTQEQLDESLGVQDNLFKLGYQEELGEICLRLGFLTKEQVEEILEVQRGNATTLNQLYGKVALQNYLLTLEQLRECLALQKEAGGTVPLGHYALKKRYISPQDHNAILKRIEMIRTEKGGSSRFKIVETKEEDPEDNNRKYGKAALLGGFVTSEQLDEYFKFKRTDPKFPYDLLQDYLIQRSYISKSDHMQIVNLMEKTKKSTLPFIKQKSQVLFMPYVPAEKRVCLEKLRQSFSEDALLRELEKASPGDLNSRLRDLLPDYTLERKLGRGGMAVVFKGKEKESDRPVAIKVMLSPTLRSPDHEEEKANKIVLRFVQEAGILSALDHPNIIKILDAGSEAEYLYYVMEYVRGKTLLEVLEDTPANYIEERWALEIARDIARGLTETWAHAIIHRDIKAENIMISREGEVKIFDFGIAKIFHPAFSERKLTSQNVILGTPLYISPEQAKMKGDSVLDFRTDMYSLGVTLYLMVVGEPPYYAKSPLALVMMHVSEKVPHGKHVRPEIQKETSDLIHRMMAKKPEDRFPSYEALIEEIDGILEKLK